MLRLSGRLSSTLIAGILIAGIALLGASMVRGQETGAQKYMMPPKVIADLIDAPPDPIYIHQPRQPMDADRALAGTAFNRRSISARIAAGRLAD